MLEEHVEVSINTSRKLLMSIFELQSDYGQIAKNFLGWEPPLAREVALRILESLTFSKEIFYAQELDRLTKFWNAKGIRRTLPDFKNNTRAKQRNFRKLWIAG